MKLKTFRVWNFRSINDSGDIDVKRITALLGRNESGKSNLLLALRSLNPVVCQKRIREKMYENLTLNYCAYQF